MALTGRRIEDPDEIEVVEAFTWENFQRDTEDQIGCSQDVTLNITKEHVERNNVVWFAAYDEEILVAATGVVIHPPGPSPCHLWFVVGAFGEGVNNAEAYLAMHQPILTEISWPGCCQNIWSIMCDDIGVNHYQKMAAITSTNFESIASEWAPGWYVVLAQMIVPNPDATYAKYLELYG